MSRLLALALICLASASARSAELASISVTPSAPVVIDGTLQRFIATGTFKDGSTSRLGNATLAAGGNHTCAIVRDGSVRCWGQNGAGQAGSAGVTSVPAFVGIVNAISLAGGFQHSCAVRTGGEVSCWGRGAEGQLGNGVGSGSGIPVTVSGLTGSTAVAVGAGFLHSCALLSSGGVSCWGENSDGQLGNGTFADSTTAVAVSGIQDAVGLSVGGNDSCALLASGSVRCWGANNSGQLGNGGSASSNTPVAVGGITGAVALASGFDYACALLADGGMRCWGRGLEGQLGNGGQSSSPVPVSVQLAGPAVALSASTRHTCALLATGPMQCWGSNGNGQLGNATLVGTFPNPGFVSGLGENPIAITTGFEHTCAVLPSGGVRCWGLNDSGQLGNGGSAQRSGTPVAVNGRAVQVNAGGNHTCALGSGGTATCWGDGFYGQLGQGSGSAAPPVTVSGVQNAIDIALGFDHTCAVLDDGGGRCWGRNHLGQLGINTFNPTQTPTPTSLPSLDPALAIAAGAYHGCAIVEGGAVQCWGQNSVGQLAYVNGTGVLVGFPSTVAGISNAVAITAGFEHTCALLQTGSVLCWGRGDEGQLGNGGTGNTNSPVAVTGISTATAIAAGNFHTCARLASGQVQCWGRGDEGQLGNSLTADSLTPVNVDNGSGALDVTAGGFHTCLLASNASVRCWGRGDLGQLGNGTFLSRSSPQTVSDINTAVAVDAGRFHTCAVLGDGSLRCWGYNELGQLGNGGNANSSLPVVARGVSMEAVALTWSSSNTGALATRSGHVRIAGLGQSYVMARYGPISGFAAVTSALDSDADGIADPIDVCPAFPNPDQGDLDANGIGDVCECGDQNGDAHVDVQDLIAINLAIFNPQLATPLCDTNDDGRCNVRDIVGANLKIFGTPAYCSRYPTPD